MCIRDSYGTDQPHAVHYLVSSFGLEWRLGDTLLDTCRLNGSELAAAAMHQAQQCPAPAQQPDAAADDHVTVALVQCASTLGAVDANLDRLEGHIRAAAAQGAKMIVLPETAVTGYLSQDLRTNWGLPGRQQNFPANKDPREYAERRTGGSVRRMAALARELGAYITVPYLEESEGGLFNSVALVGPESPQDEPALAHYQKNCPWPHPECSWACPGDGVEQAVYDTEYGTVGLAVCFDIHSILRKYDGKDLWALLYPIAWVGDIDEWFANELPDRLARVNCPHYVLGANWATEAPQAWHGAGGSTAYGPGGQLLAHASEARFRGCEEVVLCRIPVQGSMPRVRGLDLDKYREWTEEQPGTDYWVPPPKGEGAAERAVLRGQF
eukprot:TRINITY_DN22165_c0_g1_i2.p1 TRINITY_DN22165_c0_g1~~TRINITY_DN22165_c0_g1_i2.p1  ORF type:complete len:382 (-),score=90.00 TRINITY_DN22165_c0_g1_i2:3-1148(-)